MLNSGIDIRVVQKIVGHAHLSTTMIYSHLLEKVTAKRDEKIEVQMKADCRQSAYRGRLTTGN